MNLHLEIKKILGGHPDINYGYEPISFSKESSKYYTSVFYGTRQKYILADSLKECCDKIILFFKEEINIEES